MAKKMFQLAMLADYMISLKKLIAVP